MIRKDIKYLDQLFPFFKSQFLKIVLNPGGLTPILKIIALKQPIIPGTLPFAKNA